MKSLREAVDEYRKYYQSPAKKEIVFYGKANQKSLLIAIEKAALAQTPTGKARHQRLISPSKLIAFSGKLKTKESLIAKITKFDALHEIVASCRVRGIGELAIYDTSHRIAAYLGMITSGKFRTFWVGV